MQKKSNILLSIIIPTKDRYECLFPVVCAILNKINSNQLEIVVQDNSTKHYSSFTEKINDDRLVYDYFNEEISIQENTIKAIAHSSGKYLIFIGDDDIVSYEILEIVKFMDLKNIECLTYNPSYYWWNSVQFTNPNYYYRNNVIWIPKIEKLELIEMNSKNELNKMLSSGASNFQNLPKFYHGIVSRSVLERIKTKTGSYLSGSSPDIAFSTSLSLVLVKYYYLNFPVSVFGASKNSGGGMTVSKRHYGKIEDQKFLPKNLKNVWNKNIPYIWSERSIYAQTVLEVLNSFDEYRKFNFLAFYSTILTYEPYLYKYTLKSIFKFCKLNILKYLILGFYIIKKIAGIIKKSKQFKNRKLNYDVIEIENISIAMDKISFKNIYPHNLMSL
jgi:hypothetical protein